MTLKRGDIFLQNIEEEADIKKTRPVLVIQNDIANRYAAYTIVAAIRHEMDKKLPVHVSLPVGVASLKKKSVVDCGHIATLKKEKLVKFVGHLPPRYIYEVDRALKVSFQLD